MLKESQAMPNKHNKRNASKQMGALATIHNKQYCYCNLQINSLK